ncbi:MAG: hypothetical protein KA247_01610, partial [Bacteroidetes bacterium]|nr:hypothetical protein [Bacteroidota bacterium]
MISKLYYLAFLLTLTLSAQDRVLLHIGRDGKQEAIPLRKGERAQDVIQRITQTPVKLISNPDCMDFTDTVKNYPSASSLTTNFGFTHKEVAFQWFQTLYGQGEVQEFWWYNHEKNGNIGKALIRAWYADPKLLNRPASVSTKHLGYYKDVSDGDGGVTPYKPLTGDQWFYSNGKADSSTWNFDPLGAEVAKWSPGGLQVTLDSGKWQGIKLKEWGDSMNVAFGQLFGFTVENDTKLSDIPSGGEDERMEILSWANTNAAPYHSLKYYEQGRTGADDKGWHLRGEYEFGMFVVVHHPCI